MQITRWKYKKLIGASLKTTTGCFSDYKIELGQKIIDKHRNFTILDRKRVNTQKYQYRKMYNYQCNICGYKTGWMEECDILHHQSGCACCSNRVVVEGINDMPTTDSWIPSTKYIEDISIKNFKTYLGQTQIIKNCNENKYSIIKAYKDYYFVFEPDYLENYKAVSQS